MKKENRYELTLLNLHHNITSIVIDCDRDPSKDTINDNLITDVFREILPCTQVMVSLLTDTPDHLSIRCDDPEMIAETGYIIDSAIATNDTSEVHVVEIRFRMPHSNVTISLNEIDEKMISNKEDNIMEPKNTSQQIIDSFQIDESVAKKLSDLLIKQSIRERLLNQNINNPTAYEQMESMLVPIVAEIESLKSFITRECVPAQYRSEKYVWNYDGYEIDGCTVYIYNA